MFVTTLGMDNFDCTKMNAHFEKFISCLWKGLIHESKQALLTLPLPSLVPRPSATTPRWKIREGKKEGGSGKWAYYYVQLRWNVSGAN